MKSVLRFEWEASNICHEDDESFLFSPCCQKQPDVLVTQVTHSFGRQAQFRTFAWRSKILMHPELSRF